MNWPAAMQYAVRMSFKCAAVTKFHAARRGFKCALTPTRLYPVYHRYLTYSSTHDYVICGAGSAGCVLANRLSEDSSKSVVLLEAGPKDNTWRIQMPAAIQYNLNDDKYNWFYQTEPQEYLNHRRVNWPRGRVLGGSSSLNAMVYMRGHAYDYDRWEKEGAAGWSYADCLPYFKKAQTHELGADDYRGGEGPLHVSSASLSIPVQQAIVEAGRQAGYPVTDDSNGYQQEGFSIFDHTIYKGLRWNTSNAYLKPELNRSNLFTETSALISRVIFEGNTAVGVEYTQDHQIRRVRARKEVIISGGAINSPQLLMLSGVGDAEELSKHGIPVVAHLPGVGQNLQDHPQVYVQQESVQPVTLHKYQQWWSMAPIGLHWFITKKGPCSISYVQTGAFIRSSDDVPHPDIQLDTIPILVPEGKAKSECHGYTTAASLQRPTSTGFVKLRTRNPRDHPAIDPRYLSTEEDRVLMRKSVRVVRDVHAQKALQPYNGREIQPGENVQTDDEIDEFLRERVKTNYHPSCSCKMGAASDHMAVVDNTTRVFKVENLRVVDASIMPSVVSGNLNAPTIMIAEKAADVILGKDPLPQCHVPVYETEMYQGQENRKFVASQRS